MLLLGQFKMAIFFVWIMGCCCKGYNHQCDEFPKDQIEKVLHVGPESMTLDCDELDEAVWEFKKDYMNPDAAFEMVAFPNYAWPGYKLNGSALEIGTAAKNKSGYYYCKKVYNWNYVVVKMYAVLVLGKELNSLESGLIEKNTEITLTCPADHFNMGQLIQPTIKWVFPPEAKGKSGTEDTYNFKATTDLNGSEFRCEWSYDLYANGTFVPFQSDPYILQVAKGANNTSNNTNNTSYEQ